MVKKERILDDPYVKETPLMRQYNEIKAKYPGAIILFRVGDFYETFGEEAVLASKILNITLTKRSIGAASEMELAGFPHHAIETYLPKLVKAGYRVAVCDQLEDPKTAKGIVKRGVTELVTPGLAYSDSILDRRQNNYLSSIFMEKDLFGISFLDISTGEYLVNQGSLREIEKLLESFSPSEVIISKKQQRQFYEIFGEAYNCYYVDEWVYNIDYADEVLKEHFNSVSLKSFGVEKLTVGLIAAGAIIRYLEETEHRNIDHIKSLKRIISDQYVWMDSFTISSLELIRSQREDGASLLEIIDETNTPMGARMIVKWLLFPLKSIEQINARLSIVEELITNNMQHAIISGLVKQIGDLERLCAKVSVGRVNPREVMALAKSLSQITPLRLQLTALESQSAKEYCLKLPNFKYIISEIQKTIVENPPALMGSGMIIKQCVSAELDELRNIHSNGKDCIQEILADEIRRTGISSLKVGYNKVFGYYLEVTNTHKDKVPKEWIRKQTLANVERYVTETLKIYEDKILNAEQRCKIIEDEIYKELVLKILQYVTHIQQSAEVVAQVDCLLSFANRARTCNYTKPVFNESNNLIIRSGRHPVIEAINKNKEEYIPNDIILNQDDQQIIVVTGPNMAGKSALLRQTALIVIMAQMGSFVPAESLELGIIDKIFTRVGASDNIAKGESTFMTEMIETATIMNNMSARSLILMDEIGRGTSTYDGISIAWSLVEYLHNQNNLRPKTLFATHYHELNELADKLERVKNFSINVHEFEDRIIFLRKLVPGGSSHSFGINVATMAGMPKDIVQRASQILESLENGRTREESKMRLRDVPIKKYQLALAEIDPKLQKTKEFFENLELESMTPIEALLKLNELKQFFAERK